MHSRLAAAGSILGVLLAAAPFPGVAASKPNDPLYRYQWALEAIHAPAAWGYATGEGVIVAVVDNGVNYHHEDLSGKVLLARGRDTLCEPASERCDDADVGATGGTGHGTMVAGIIAANTNNREGIAGVAPDAKIISVAFSSEQDIDAGIRFAVNRGARVINMSFGNFNGYPRIVGEPIDRTPNGMDVNFGGKHFASALQYAWSKGAVLVGGAGNDGLPYCNFPANEEHTICVGATDPRNIKAAYSNFGLGLDLVAPGGSPSYSNPCGTSMSKYVSDEEIVSTRGDTESYCGEAGGYHNDFGTSYATPHVAGIAALLLSKGLTNTQVVACLEATADDLGTPGWDPLYGWGLVNAYRAVKYCRP